MFPALIYFSHASSNFGADPKRRENNPLDELTDFSASAINCMASCSLPSIFNRRFYYTILGDINTGFEYLYGGKLGSYTTEMVRKKSPS